jgi:hypothetical protein
MFDMLKYDHFEKPQIWYVDIKSCIHIKARKVLIAEVHLVFIAVRDFIPVTPFVSITFFLIQYFSKLRIF